MDGFPRWAGGVSLIPDGEGLLVHTPAEEFLVVEPEPGRPADPAAPELRAAFAAEGVLAPEPAPRPGPVGIGGTGPLADHLARSLAGLGLDVLRGPEEDLLDRGLLALVSAEPWLPDRRWSDLDPRVRAAGVPWHRGHAEGRRWYAGPFWTGPGDSGHTDLRIRRLAATPWPEQLAAYWDWLDGGGRPAPDPSGAVAAAAAAAFLAADLWTWRCGGDPAGRNVQVGIDLADGVVRRHPVLPVPQGLMREVPA
ncbi:hypothetical protein [Spirillospora albida]|uniref:hypothetical protein n=1 Tax=Spirillospora albida TaxID=58123 RepID=UPI0004C0E554|nr:hypothetical protein [Spirillospora albida]